MLSAVGIKSNIEGLGLEELGVRVERDKIAVDEHYRTNVEGVYAVGDIVPGPALAHVASAEALHCVEHICGVESDPVDYSVIPSCVFTSPEVASVGLTEREAEVLRLLARNKRPREISDVLVVSVATVRSHVHAIYTKTGVHSAAELAKLVECPQDKS